MIDLTGVSPVVNGSHASSSLVTTANFDFTTASVVSFVLVILGLAAGLLLMIRFANRRLRKEGE